MFLRTLGDLVLEGTAFVRPKPLLLLAYLAIEGAQGRKHLSELFWPEAVKPLASLRTALTQLRQHAPGLIVGEAQLSARVDCDVQAFLGALERGELQALKGVYRGPFLKGYYLKDLGGELEEWVYSTREGLAARYREGLLRLAEGLGPGQEREAARLAEEAYWLAGAPEAEPEGLRRVYRLLLAGKSARLRELRAEAEGLGLTLEAPAQADAKKPLALPPGLPPQPTSFIGRALELSEIRNLFAQDDCRLVTILGAGGAGKTRLALRFAQEALEQGAFADGVFFVDLSALAGAELVPAEIAAALGAALPGKEPRAELVALFKDKEALLVLDNLEHLILAAGTLAGLLKHCPGVRLLVTSRERLNLTAEWVYLLEGFPVPVCATGAEGLDAVRLFTQRARRSRHDFDAEGQLPHILEICRLVHGSPLGIELAAAWVRVMSPAEIAAEISQNLDVLRSAELDASERQGSLRAAFDYSWGLLLDHEREALRRLAAFHGSFTHEAARQVTGASLLTLSALVDKAMLSRDPSGRYSRHPLIVQFANEKAQEHPEEAAGMLAQHGAYYLGLLARELKRLKEPRVPKTLELELDNLRDAWRVMVTQGDEGALNQALPLYDHLYTLMGRYGEAEAAFALAAQALQEGTVLWARARARQGKHQPFLGRYQTGARLLESGLAVFRQHESREDLAFVLRHLGFSVYHLGHYEEAQAVLQESLALARALDDPPGVADSLNVLGNVTELLGDLSGAQRCHEEALAIYTRLADYGAITSSYMALGDVAAELGDYRTAKDYFLKSYRLRLELGNKGRAAGSLARLGDVTLLEGKLAEAEGLYWQALALALQARGLPWLTEALLGLAKVFARTGQRQRAITVASSVHAQPDTTRWFKERSGALLRELGQAQDAASLPSGDLLELAEALLAWRAGSNGPTPASLAEEAAGLLSGVGAA